MDSFGANATDEQLAIANRKIISLTNGVDPRQLSERGRNYAAEAREKEAVRLQKRDDKFDNFINQIQKFFGEKGLKVEIDGKGNVKEGETPAVNVSVEVKDSPTSRSTITRANPSDTARSMDLSGTYFQPVRTPNGTLTNR